MNNKTYDVIKLLLLVPTPLITCILALSEIFAWAPGAKIAAAVSAIATCLGYYLIDSSKKYHDELEKIEGGLEDTLNEVTNE